MKQVSRKTAAGCPLMTECSKASSFFLLMFVNVSRCCSPVQNILGIQGVPHQFFLEVYYTFYKIPEARTGDVVMGLLCLCLLTMLTFMKSNLVSNDSASCSRMARKFIWTVATSQYLCVTDADVLKVAFPVLSFLSSSFWTVRNALLVVAASLFAFSCEAYGHYFFTITGHTSQGLPPFRPPPTSDTTSNGTTVSFGEMLKVRMGGRAGICGAVKHNCVLLRTLVGGWL